MRGSLAENEGVDISSLMSPNPLAKPILQADTTVHCRFLFILTELTQAVLRLGLNEALVSEMVYYKAFDHPNC